MIEFQILGVERHAGRHARASIDRHSGCWRARRHADRQRRPAPCFLLTPPRKAGPEQSIEKDFWVCWTLDALFNGLPAGAPRMLFRGGTLLSKVFGLISRFSEDIDVTATISAKAPMSKTSRT